MAAPNIISLTTITGKNTQYAVTGTLANVGLAVAAGQLIRVNTIIAANITTATVNLRVSVYRGSTHRYLCYDIPVPAGASVIVLGKADGGLNLEESDLIYAYSSTAAALDLTVSYDVLS